MSRHQLLLDETAEYVKGLFDQYNRQYLLYHNITHTRNVVKHASEIADHYQLDERSVFILLTAAWFHDTGQLEGDMAVHEERSVAFMEEFFSDKDVDRNTLDNISKCIMATKMPVEPTNQLEMIICDADTWHLGTVDFQRLD